MELQFLFSAHRLIMIYIRAKFGENIMNGLSYGADTISILIITKERNSVRGITVLVLCKSSDHGLHLYQHLEWFKSYGADTICDGQTDRHTGGQTNIYGKNNMFSPFSR